MKIEIELDEKSWADLRKCFSKIQVISSRQLSEAEVNGMFIRTVLQFGIDAIIAKADEQKLKGN